MPEHVVYYHGNNGTKVAFSSVDVGTPAINSELRCEWQQGGNTAESLTLADAVRAQSVRWYSFVLWYCLGVITGKMYRCIGYKYRFLYPGDPPPLWVSNCDNSILMDHGKSVTLSPTVSVLL